MDDNFTGRLLLLFFVLAIHLVCNLFRVGPSADALKNGVDAKVHSCEMTAFQKITMGVPISINRESLEGLTAVPGIGPGIASSIIRERARRNGFKRLDEIKSIKGIGPGLYVSVKPYLIL